MSLAKVGTCLTSERVVRSIRRQWRGCGLEFNGGTEFRKRPASTMPLCTSCTQPVGQLWTEYSTVRPGALSCWQSRLTAFVRSAEDQHPPGELCPVPPTEPSLSPLLTTLSPLMRAQSSCKAFADPYVEQPLVVYALDLLLLKPEVYRSVAYNFGWRPTRADQPVDDSDDADERQKVNPLSRFGNALHIQVLTFGGDRVRMGCPGCKGFVGQAEPDHHPCRHLYVSSCPCPLPLRCQSLSADAVVCRVCVGNSASPRSTLDGTECVPPSFALVSPSPLPFANIRSPLSDERKEDLQELTQPSCASSPPRQDVSTVPAPPGRLRARAPVIPSGRHARLLSPDEFQGSCRKALLRPPTGRRATEDQSRVWVSLGTTLFAPSPFVCESMCRAS